MPALCSMLLGTYYAFNYAGIIGRGLARYIHACTNEIHFLANLKDLVNPYFGRHNYKQHKPAKAEIKSCRFARECVSFVHAWMYLPSWNCVFIIS